jgi:hypothetical protein
VSLIGFDKIVRPEVQFLAWDMETKLRKRDKEKGGWDKDTLMQLVEKLYAEVDELYDAIENPAVDYYDDAIAEDNPNGEIIETHKYQTRVRDEAVDVANFAMMIFNIMSDHPTHWMHKTPFRREDFKITNEGGPD